MFPASLVVGELISQARQQMMKMILTHEGLSLQLVSICDSLLA
jgi:hypothetical protein